MFAIFFRFWTRPFSFLTFFLSSTTWTVPGTHSLSAKSFFGFWKSF